MLLEANMPIRRVGALVLRQYYLLRSSWSRLVELFFWSTVNLAIWGFLSRYLMQQQATPALAFGVLIAGAVLWEITFRSQYAIMLGTLEELWSRNMAQLFSTPLRPGEYLIGMVIFSFLRTTLIIALCALFVRIAFGFSVLDLGWALLAFYFLLMMTGWWTGIMLCGLLFRYGLTVEWMVWMAAFILQPLAGVFYPVTVLPVWLQPVSWILPPTYAFEGMRAVLQQGVVRYDLLLASLALNLIYLALACWLFLRAFERARQHGSLLNGSE